MYPCCLCVVISIFVLTIIWLTDRRSAWDLGAVAPLTCCGVWASHWASHWASSEASTSFQTRSLEMQTVHCPCPWGAHNMDSSNLSFNYLRFEMSLVICLPLFHRIIGRLRSGSGWTIALSTIMSIIYCSGIWERSSSKLRLPGFEFALC